MVELRIGAALFCWLTLTDTPISVEKATQLKKEHEFLGTVKVSVWREVGRMKTVPRPCQLASLRSKDGHIHPSQSHD
jgi:hypothetical protein